MRQQSSTVRSFPSSLPRCLFVALAIASLLIIAGCSPQIGDDCDNDSDCPSEASCDRSTRDGICTIKDCKPGDCPSESVCAQFGRHESYCLRSCSGDDDCRDDHSCIDDEELEISYCFVSES